MLIGCYRMLDREEDLLGRPWKKMRRPLSECFLLVVSIWRPFGETLSQNENIKTLVIQTAMGD